MLNFLIAYELVYEYFFPETETAILGTTGINKCLLILQVVRELRQQILRINNAHINLGFLIKHIKP